MVGTRLTFMKAAPVWIQQCAHVLVYHLQRVYIRALCRYLGQAFGAMARRHVLAGAGAKIYDIAPVVRLLIHLLSQPVAAGPAGFLMRNCC